MFHTINENFHSKKMLYFSVEEMGDGICDGAIFYDDNSIFCQLQNWKCENVFFLRAEGGGMAQKRKAPYQL